MPKTPENFEELEALIKETFEEGAWSIASLAVDVSKVQDFTSILKEEADSANIDIIAFATRLKEKHIIELVENGLDPTRFVQINVVCNIKDLGVLSNALGQNSLNAKYTDKFKKTLDFLSDDDGDGKVH